MENLGNYGGLGSVRQLKKSQRKVLVGESVDCGLVVSVFDDNMSVLSKVYSCE